MFTTKLREKQNTRYFFPNYRKTNFYYDNLPEGHTIVFQTDSSFCDPNADDNVSRLNTLSQYDYIGAPWKWWTGKNDQKK